MTDRRSFIATVSAIGGWLTTPSWAQATPTAPRVEALSSLLFAHPDGTNNLVRFRVTGIDAPAGRLRVYDRARRLLGTAGVLRREDALHGELWLALERETTVISEFEAPGLLGPLRSSHRLTPQRQWTLHLLSTADPATITRTLEGLPPVRQAVQASAYKHYGVTTNPLPPWSELVGVEHVPFLRMADAALSVERRFGIPMSDAAVITPGQHLSANAITALAGSGVRLVTIEQTGSDPFQWLTGPDGSRILAIVLPPGGTTSDLGFTRSSDDMVQRIETWLATSPLFLSPAYERNAAVIVSSAGDRDLMQVSEAVAEWNSRFAYPRITVGSSDPLLEFLDDSRGVSIPVTEPARVVANGLPSVDVLSNMSETADTASAERAGGIVAVLARLLGAEGPSLEAIASEVAAIVPGTLVFNPSPFSRSGLVRMTDGTDRIATNVPGLGYAYFPDAAAGSSSESEETAGWTALDDRQEIQGQRFRIRVDRSSGAIRSIVDRANGREWVRPGSRGVNSVDGSRVETIQRWRLPGAASRIDLQRWAPGRGSLHTQITVYDHIPWIDMVNDAEAVGGHIGYRFDFDVTEPSISWEVPVGYDQSSPPIEVLQHLRWIQLAGREDAILFRGIDSPIAEVESNGSLLSHATAGQSRYRCDSHSRYEGQDSPWIFGWNTESFLTARVEPQDTGRLPTFGNIFDIDRVGIAVLGITTAYDHDGIIVYLQELLGVDRQVSVRPGVVRFDDARLVDYLERDKGESLQLANDGVMVPVRGRGVTAVRLSGLELNNT